MKRTPEQEERRRKWLATMTPEVLVKLTGLTPGWAERLIRKAKERE